MENENKKIPHRYYRTVNSATDTIEIRKKIKQIIHEAEENSKPTTCILCGKEQTSFCNSHSIPKMILQNITDDGIVYNANEFIDFGLIDKKDGINRSGVFRYICKQCDSTYFQDYENEENLKNKPSDRLLAEIALKNVLIQVSKREREIELFKSVTRDDEMEYFFNYPKLLDYKEYMNEIQLYKDIIDNNQIGVFRILFYKRLPYNVSIAVQSLLALQEDMEGNQVNNIYDYAEETRMENLHLCVFPLQTETIVLLFVHRRDKSYRRLYHQFNTCSDEKALSYINWLIFKYTENYFISKSACGLVNDKLRELSKENGGLPNFGFIDKKTIINGYNRVQENEIPNFLVQR